MGPPPTTIAIENKITTFDKHLKSLQINVKERNKNINHFNLTKPQLQTLWSLKNNKEFVVKPSDKNLGPVIMNTEDYIKMALIQHLLTTNYQQLPPQQAKNHLENIKNTLKNLLHDHKDTLTIAEQTFFQKKSTTTSQNSTFLWYPKSTQDPNSPMPGS